MDLTFVIDKDFERKKYVRHNDACLLMDEALARKHRVFLVHPQRIKGNEGKVEFNEGKAEFYEQFELVGGCREGYLEPVDIDLVNSFLLVRSYGYNQRTNDKLVSVLRRIEEEGGIALDSSYITSLANKERQKNTIKDVPFPYTFDFKSKEDVMEAVKQGERIFGKPKVSFQSIGGVYLESPQDVDEKISVFDDKKFDEYTFERYIDADGETRVTFFDGEVQYGRWKPLVGPAGKQRRDSWDQMRQVEPTDYQKEITRRVMDQGFFFGGVDFRSGHLLEINGSHISVRGGKPNFYIDVIDKIEEMWEGSDLVKPRAIKRGSLSYTI